MHTYEEAGRLAAALPEVTEGRRFGNRTWFVRGRPFAWERPFSKADIKRFGKATPPPGPIFAVRVADLETKEVLLMNQIRGFFTIEHFDGFPGILIQLEEISRGDLEVALTDAWLACAPPDLITRHLAELPGGGTRGQARD